MRALSRWRIARLMAVWAKHAGTLRPHARGPRDRARPALRTVTRRRAPRNTCVLPRSVPGRSTRRSSAAVPRRARRLRFGGRRSRTTPRSPGGECCRLSRQRRNRSCAPARAAKRDRRRRNGPRRHSSLGAGSSYAASPGGETASACSTGAHRGSRDGRRRALRKHRALLADASQGRGQTGTPADVDVHRAAVDYRRRHSSV
jgi:hypothetical protein